MTSEFRVGLPSSIAMACAGATFRRSLALTRRFVAAGSAGAVQGLRADDGWSSGRTRRTEDRVDPSRSLLCKPLPAADATYLKAHRTATSLAARAPLWWPQAVRRRQLRSRVSCPTLSTYSVQSFASSPKPARPSATSTRVPADRGRGTTRSASKSAASLDLFKCTFGKRSPRRRPTPRKPTEAFS